MASSKLISLITSSCFILLPFFISPSLGDVDLKTLVTPETICKSTPYPSYCISILPNKPANAYDYGRFSVKQSLSQSQRFLNLLDTYLQNRSILSTPLIRALEDCNLLASLNMDFFSSSLETINNVSATLPTSRADDVQTKLSATLTNQQTCLDSIEATDLSGFVKSGLSGPLSNDTKLYSVCLALVTRGWVPNWQEVFTWKPTNGRKFLQEQAGDSKVKVSCMVIVNKDGSGNFTTINAAIAAAPNNTDGTNGYFLIYITAGVYKEYVSIAKNKNYLMIVGEGINRTVITGKRSVADGWTTFNSATFAVVGQNFVAVNITFRNTAGAVNHQAVAFRSGADFSAFYRCSFEGYQDTLYTHSLRQFYRECDIYGTVDFIFGDAAVVLQKCNLYPRQPMSGQFNAITAQGRMDSNQNTGTSIHNCLIRATDDLASSNYTVKTYLGRPWKEYSRTVYMLSFMDSLIDPAGWHEWSGDFALQTLYYAEYNNTGPGSRIISRVKWPGYHVIKAKVASKYTVSNFISGDDWLPKTGVPYTGGLF